MSHFENSVKMKVEMKMLLLTEQSKKQIQDTLKFLHGEEFSHKDRSDYKDKGERLDRKYWVDTGSLVIQSCTDNSSLRKKVLLPHEQVKMFALSKLKKYGFHPTHCMEALKITSGDVGGAFEILMARYFDIPLPDPDEVPPDILEEREQELDSIRSIYDNCCEEKIANQLWVVKLDLEYLMNFYSNKNKNMVCYSEMKKKCPKEANICKYFFKGHCRFGDKCRFSHLPPVKEPIKEDHDGNRNKFELEVRFPSGCKYPREPPLVSIISLSGEFPPDSCLRITKCLLNEAKACCLIEQPCLFTLIDLLLNGQDKIISILEEKESIFYPPSMLLFPKTDDDNSEGGNGILLDEAPSQELKSERHSADVQKVKKEDDELCQKFRDKQRSMRYKTLVANRRKLPAWGKKEAILEAIRDNQIVIISGETGCGKSTQVPQFLLDNWLVSRNSTSHVEIICTQPRRLSAIGVAERVSAERMERIPESVGYQIRLETKTSPWTRLLFCTTGILLRRLEGEPFLGSVTHIIVDEVHERSEESDFLLMILKDLLPKRPDLKVILMSATMNTNLFRDYFDNPPIVEIPGRTFSVEQYFLEDILESTNYVLEECSQSSRKLGKMASSQLQSLETDLELADIQSIEMLPYEKVKDENLTIQQLFYRYKGYSRQTCKAIYLMDNDKINNELIEIILLWIIHGEHQLPKEGSILVFLPGMAEITALHEILNDNPYFCPNNGKCLLVPLHSSLTNEEQNLVFKKTDKHVRKIVLSTNIAETSITIDDCVFVIDSGRMKEKRFDSNKNMESLETVWVSRANALQRKGRAGRVMPGVCIHLYTRHCFDYIFISQPVPEIQRVPLEQLLLKIKMLPYFSGGDIYSILNRIIEPPSNESITGAITRLQNLGAFNEFCDLTALGKHLASLPVDVRIGKLILFGTIFCCIDSALTIAACLSYKSPFVSPFDKKDDAAAKKKEFVVAHSDHLTILKAYKCWMKVSSQGKHAGMSFANENFLSVKTLTTLADIKTQFLELLVDIGFVPRTIKLPRKKTGVDRILEITGSELNIHGDNPRLLSAILCAALYPNIVKVLTPEKQYTHSISGAIPMNQKAEELKFETKEEKVVIHPSSVNHNISSFPSPYLVYQEKIKTSRVFIRDCTLVPVLPLVLFSAGTIRVELYCGQFVVSLGDGWILFTVQSNQVAELLESIKQEFITLLEEKIKDPRMNLQTHPKGRRIVSTIVNLVTYG